MVGKMIHPHEDDTNMHGGQGKPILLEPTIRKKQKAESGSHITTN
jgi:hypothetical protein